MSERATALLFPGQGSRGEGMRELVESERPDLLKTALGLCGADPFAEPGLSTALDQPAIYCATIAAFERLGRPRAAFHLGHSLGEVAALVAAEALDPLDGLRLVAIRGELMERSGLEAAAGSSPGGMVAVRAGVGDVARVAARHGVCVANDNASRQVVLSGPIDGLDAAAAELAEAGVRSTSLPVAGAFHSPAMAGAVAAFRAELDAVEFRRPQATVISGVTAAPFGDPRDLLARAITSPVRFRESLLVAADAGVLSFSEVGPGRVLTGLARRVLPEAEIAELEGAHV